MTGLAGLVAEFGSADALADAIRRMRKVGYRDIDAFTPFPVAEVGEALGQETDRVAWIAGLSALTGAAIMLAVQWWAGAAYPLDIGGRPVVPWPAFVSTTAIAGILWAAVGTFVGLMRMMRLPRFNHPIFDLPGYRRLWDGRFLLMVDSGDPRFEADATRALLAELAASEIHEVTA